jgi:NAD(P)-dependent dehydrogenase (short-subunit alcohol dehydrogenase family)
MSGKVVLITGGANGIGAATGAELARRGWVPVAADIDASGDTIALDVLEAGACEHAVEMVLERHGRLDAVWANAGIASFGPLGATDPIAWERTIEVNLLGAFRTVRAALPVIESRGYVAVTASLASFAHEAVPDMERMFEDQVAEHGALHCSLGERERRRIGANVP